jgi:hypothetical protein
MKYLLSFILSVVFIGCAASVQPDPKINAVQFDFTPYAGKTIKSIDYCDNCGYSGDILIITFTDETVVKVWAYKYNMKVYI